jgi:hypothetical protein
MCQANCKVKKMPFVKNALNDKAIYRQIKPISVISTI